MEFVASAIDYVTSTATIISARSNNKTCGNGFIARRLLLRRFQALPLTGSITVHSACFFATASYCARTNITSEKTLRPFDSVDSRVRSLTRVNNVASMRRYR